MFSLPDRRGPFCFWSGRSEILFGLRTVKTELGNGTITGARWPDYGRCARWSHARLEYLSRAVKPAARDRERPRAPRLCPKMWRRGGRRRAIRKGDIARSVVREGHFAFRRRAREFETAPTVPSMYSNDYRYDSRTRLAHCARNVRVPVSTQFPSETIFGSRALSSSTSKYSEFADGTRARGMVEKPPS